MAKKGSGKAVFCTQCTSLVGRTGRGYPACIKNFCNNECRKRFYDKRRRLDSHGYVVICAPDDYPWKEGRLGAGRHIREHIYKAAKVLGRPLRKGEVVHHIDCNKSNNANSNLLICSQAYHKSLHARMGDAWAREHFPKKEVV